MTRISWGALVLAAIAVLGACAGEPERRGDPHADDGGAPDGGDAGAPAVMLASDYDRRCATNDDCVAVEEGACPRRPGCPNAAINGNAWPAYGAALERLRCEADHGVDRACEPVVAICEAGGCIVTEPPSRIDAGGYSRRCEKNDDCWIVPTNACACADFVAIARDEVERYEADRLARACGTPSPGCQGVGLAIACTEGECVIPQVSFPD